MKKLENKREEIVKKYNAGATQQELAEEYGVSYNTIANRILEYYGRARTSSYIRKRNIILPIEEIAKRNKSGVTHQEIADEYGVSRQTISRHLLKYYKETDIPNPKIKNPKRFKNIPVEEIAKKHEQNISQKQLAKDYGVTRRTISRKLKKYYEDIGKPLTHKGISYIDLPAEEIIKRYEEGTSKSILAEEYTTSEPTISKVINKYYKSIGLETPRILKSVTIVVNYLNKGLTIEQIVEIAQKKNIIIPQSIIDTALDNIKNKDLTDDNDAR